MRLLPIAALAVALAAPAFAADPPVRLYKALGTKEDVVIGLTAADFKEMESDADPKGPMDQPRRPSASDADLDMIGDRLVGSGHLKAWLYGPRRGADGTAEWSPLRRVVLFGAHVIRLEPHAAGEKVVAPAAK